MASSSTAAPAKPGLVRVLGLWSLVIYGIVLIQPTAPMSPFGVVSVKAQGHVVTTILIGMVAMLFTAISYGRMAAVYPSAGSAYAYVGHTIHPSLGYVTGWSMLFDYVMNPIICVIWCSKAAANFLPLPFAVWATFFALLFTVLNLQGVKTSARTNAVIAGGLGARDPPLPRRRLPLPVRRPPRRGGPHAALLRPRDLLLGQGVDGHQPRRAHLHRLRRDLDALGGGEEPAPQHPARDRGSSASSPGSWAASRSTWPSSSGPTGRATRTSTPRSSTWPAAPGARSSSRS